jgi:hypothetical protein
MKKIVLILAIAISAIVPGLEPFGPDSRQDSSGLTLYPRSNPAPLAMVAPHPRPAPLAMVAPHPRPAPLAMIAPHPRPAPLALVAPHPRPAPFALPVNATT